MAGLGGLEGSRRWLGAPASEAMEPEARRRKAGAREARAWRAGLGGAEGRGRMLRKAAGAGRSGDSGRERAPPIVTGQRAHAQGLVRGGRARARENRPSVTVTRLVSTRDAGRGGKGRGWTSFSEWGNRGILGVGYLFSA